jgi:energy-coupling factor transport system ATP-binding protein
MLVNGYLVSRNVWDQAHTQFPRSKHLIRFKGVSYRYPETERWALQGISTEFSANEVILLAGPNGGGKSTLLKAILGVVPQSTGGDFQGEITFNGKSLRDFTTVQLAGQIGIVLQDPDMQVTNLSVADEVYFGMANLLLPKEVILQRGKEALQRLGIEHLRDSSVLALSGGQLQRLSLAGLLAMQPEVLILDEPVTNLDPHGVASVIDAIRSIQPYVKLMIISSHWLDPFLDMATRVVVVNQGQIVLDEKPDDLRSQTATLTEFGVQIPQLWQLEDYLSKQGVQLQPGYRLPRGWTLLPAPNHATNFTLGSTHLILQSVGYSYSNGDKPLNALSAVVHKGERIALIGHNGAGKSTLARMLAGLRKPTSGTLTSHVKKVGMMLQRPTLSFITTSVREEVSFGTKQLPADTEQILYAFGLHQYADVSPFLLSGGEQRRLALAIALLGNPDLLILDEPTAGLDATQVEVFLHLLKGHQGTVILISHDPRVVSLVDRIIVVGNGGIVFNGLPHKLDDAVIQYLGYDRISPTVQFAIQHSKFNIPLIPEQVRVGNVGL